MKRARVVVSVLAMGAAAAFAPVRKEGIRATVQSVGGDTVRIDVIGTAVLTQGFLRGMYHFGADRPYHATTPLTFFPSLMNGPVEIRTVPGKHIKVLVENLVNREHIEGTGRSVEVSRSGSVGPVQLSAKP